MRQLRETHACRVQEMTDTTRLIVSVVVGAVLFGLAVYGLEIARDDASDVFDAALSRASDI
jgi:hypothetical protein